MNQNHPTTLLIINLYFIHVAFELYNDVKCILNINLKYVFKPIAGYLFELRMQILYIYIAIIAAIIIEMFALQIKCISPHHWR